MRFKRSTLLVLLLPTPACDAPPLAQMCSASNTTPVSVDVPATVERGVWPHEPAGFTPVSDGIPGVSRESGWRCEGDVSLASDHLVFTYRPGFQSGYAPGVAYLDVPT